jgi:hypothetical protein
MNALFAVKQKAAKQTQNVDVKDKVSARVINAKKTKTKPKAKKTKTKTKTKPKAKKTKSRKRK